MAVDYKIKEVFKRTGFTMMRYAAEKGVAFQSMSRKINHGKWTVDQLYELAKITGCTLRCSFTFADGTRLYLSDPEMKGDEFMVVDYNELLYEKVQAEYDAFIEELKQMKPEEVIDRAYEKVCKENMVSVIQENNLTPSEAKALCREKYPLDYMYQEWRDADVSEMQMLRDSIDDTAKKAVKEMKDKQRESR